jgi:1-acyl-sn-glycerol-3-phosphate acyltransferase
MNSEMTIFKIQKILLSSYAKVLLESDIQFEAPLFKGPKIIVANHPTTTDPFFLSLLSDEPVFIPVTGMAFEVPVFGRILRLAGHIPVDDVMSKGPTVIEQAVEKLSAGKTIGIFPEGRLSPAIGDFFQTKTGAARMALLSGVPVIPVGIHLKKDSYFEKVMTTENHTDTARVVYRGKYVMTVGKPMQFSGDVEDHSLVRNIAEQIMQNIIQQAKKSESRMELNPVRKNMSIYGGFQQFLRFSQAMIQRKI